MEPNTAQVVTHNRELHWLVCSFKNAPVFPNLGAPVKEGARTQVHLMPYNAAVSEALSGAGIHAPFDRTKGYTWPGKFTPYVHQKSTAMRLIDNKRIWVLNEMRTGKTSSALWAADILRREGKCKRLLVLSPNSVKHDSWWVEQRYINPELRIYESNSTVADLRYEITTNKKAWDMVIINHEKVNDTWQAIVEYDPHVIIVDEATEYKGPTAKRVSSIQKMMERLPKAYFWPMTGTPRPDSPLDVWGLGRIMRPDVVPRLFSSWRQRTMVQVSAYKWVPTLSAHNLVLSVLSPSVKVVASEVLDMPTMVDSYRMVPMASKTKKLLKELREANMAVYDGSVVDAENAAVLYIREMQIKSGIVNGTDGKPITVGADGKYAQLRSILSETTGKVVVMCPLIDAQYHIRDKLKRDGITAVCINGTMNDAQKADAKKLFTTKGNDVRVLILHPKVGQYGMNLSIADIQVWWIPTLSNTQFQQASHRIVSAGKNSVGRIMLYTDNKEKAIYDKLVSGEFSQTDLLSYIRSTK